MPVQTERMWVQHGAAVTPEGEVVITGFFQGTATLPTAASSITLSSSSGIAADILLAKFSRSGKAVCSKAVAALIPPGPSPMTSCSVTSKKDCCQAPEAGHSLPRGTFPHGGKPWTVRAERGSFSLTVVVSSHVPEQSEKRLQGRGWCCLQHRPGRDTGLDHG